MPRSKQKKKKKNILKRTPEEQAIIDANHSNKGKMIGRWKEEQMRKAFDR